MLSRDPQPHAVCSRAGTSPESEGFGARLLALLDQLGDDVIDRVEGAGVEGRTVMDLEADQLPFLAFAGKECDDLNDRQGLGGSAITRLAADVEGAGCGCLATVEGYPQHETRAGVIEDQ